MYAMHVYREVYSTKMYKVVVEIVYISHRCYV